MGRQRRGDSLDANRGSPMMGEISSVLTMIQSES